MAEKFTNFVLALAEDPQALAKFMEDPTPAMEAADLSRAEQAVMTSGNAAMIRQAITADVSADEVGGELAGSIWPITVVIAVTVVVTHLEEVRPVQ